MASYQIPAIEAFDFSTPTEWPNWIRRFERFRKASGIAEKSEESQIDTLIYSMGDKADDILQSFNLSEEALESYKTVKERFDTHFIQRRNIIFERAKFNSRKQEPGESVDDFITDLHCLARYCNCREQSSGLNAYLLIACTLIMTLKDVQYIAYSYMG